MQKDYLFEVNYNTLTLSGSKYKNMSSEIDLCNVTEDFGVEILNLNSAKNMRKERLTQNLIPGNSKKWRKT
jgi:hypothetical protein